MSDQFVNATGRRKTSTARVRLRRGNGDFVVNGKKLDDYFGRAVLRLIIKQPFELLELDGRLMSLQIARVVDMLAKREL